jgi:hypothetical protein
VLTILVVLVRLLNINVRREKKNDLAHRAEPRIRLLIASQDVTCAGSFR